MITQQDNLILLKTIPDNHIDLIYSDILYGTGRNFGEFKDLKPNRTIIEDFYKPRLIAMRRVLKTTGQIYLQMDWRITHWLRCLLDDVFGYDQFRNEIIWQYNSAPRRKGCFGNRHDTILRYSKTDDFYFDPVREPYALSAPRGYAKERYYHPDGKVAGDVWQINMLGQNDRTERVGYPTQKPLAVIEPIVKSSCPPNGLTADFFMGSGTTAVVCKKLNIDFIGCDISSKAIELTRSRLCG